MQNALRILGLFAMCLVIEQGAAQDRLPVSSLCDLQTQIAQGEHRVVRVGGVYLNGLDVRYLVAPGCSDHSTRVEFALTTRENWTRLARMSDNFKGTLVIFEGEFYGPPVPDPKLPEGIRKVYHPGWDNNAMTKLVVYSIRSVKALPADHPCAPPKSDPSKKWPCFQGSPAPDKEGATNP